MSNWEYIKKYWLPLSCALLILLATLGVVGLKLALLIGAVRWLWS